MKLLAKSSPLAAICLLAATGLSAAQPHTVQGMLLNIDPATRSITVSCEPIPGYMEAMVMPFVVRDPRALKTMQPGSNLRFTMIEKGHTDFAERIEVIAPTNFESEPTEAARLTFLHRALDTSAAARVVEVGQPVPDFILTDPLEKVTDLAQFKGKVIALTFAYARCPNPTYCFRLSNNLWRLSRRFRARTGNDLILLTIVIDPDNDRGKALARYADTWKADPNAWHFLTGPLADVRQIATLFGMNFWGDEGFLTHTFHTVVIDREGRLAANLEGNQFNADQLGDLVESVMRRPTSKKNQKRS